MPLDRDELKTVLEQKGATQPCHRCGRQDFTLLEGYSHIKLQEDFQPNVIGGRGPIVPVAHIVCNNCGALTAHALGALDMLPGEAGEDGE